MARKVVLIADPGIDTSFAIALALHQPSIDVLGIVASPGNVGAERATQNVHLLINAVDPPKWPRLGAAIPTTFPVDGTMLHGADGLGNSDFPSITLHQPTPGDKLLVELVREHAGQVTVIVLGPPTMLARAFDRDPELPLLIDRVVLLGGAHHEPGNASARAEFHFYLDPESARRIFRSGVSLAVIPLDVSRKLVFSPTDLLELPSPESGTCRFLRRIVPFGIRASSNLYGIEGFHLKDVMGIAAVCMPERFMFEPAKVDIEVRGELTRGMSVWDQRAGGGEPNCDWAIDADIVGIRDFLRSTLTRAN